MHTQTINYNDHDTVLEGYLAYDKKVSGKRPGILIAHDWSGCNDFAKQKAEKLTKLGYAGFAIDMFGKGILGNTKEEKSALIQPFVQDRQLLLQRITAALTTLKQIEIVDTTRLGAIGFCFGGMCVLDLARSGADLRGVVSFHGLLGAPTGLPTKIINAKVLALHGHDDPMGTPDQVLAFEDEMTKAKADWQFHVYGHTMHAFANPSANDPGFGTVYKPLADQRSWIAMQNFFTEVMV